MPATFAHPVFALPFKRFKLPLPALVCGSMAPDLAYLIPGHIPHAFRHNPVGIFVFALPVGLALTALYHRVAEKRAIPASVLVAVGVVVGAITHVVVDEFTHKRGWGPHHIALLQAIVFQAPHETIRLYKALQYGLSLAGTLVLLYLLRDKIDAWLPKRIDRLRLLYATAVMVLIGIGVPGKWYRGPGWAFVAGEWWDFFGAMVIFFLARFALPSLPRERTALIVWTLLIADELLQLAHAPWLESARATRLGAIVLGSSFSVLDLLVITAGVGCALWIDHAKNAIHGAWADAR